MAESENPRAVDLSVDTGVVADILTGFLSDCFTKSSAGKAVIGLSGGLDSSVVSALAVRALGKERVLGVIMPYRMSAPESRRDAERFADFLDIAAEVVDITPMVDAYIPNDQENIDLRRGNFAARQRMAVLYDISAREGGLVVGTSNKSEILLGYGTIFGDLACAVNPVGDLYKTQLRQLAEALDIPDYIREKIPTADLVSGQTDEADLGFTYEEADRLLYLWIDKRYTEEELIEFGFDHGFIKPVFERVRRNHFKRVQPLIAKISARTVGHEFRYVWDWSNS
ncbi:NAD+ synthase [candidate division KSB1 bacterium]